MIIEKIDEIGIMKTICYIIGCEETKKAVVIDPGGKYKQILNAIERHNLKVEYIFNTHHHADHTGLNRKLIKKTGAKLLIHKAEIPYLRQLISGVKVFTLNMSLSPKPDIIIEKDTTITVGTITFQILHTPGHSPGGLCFYANGILFTGDTLFVGRSGVTHFKGGSYSSMGKSLKKIIETYPGETKVYPGHDYGAIPTSTLDIEKKSNVTIKEFGLS